jgi:adenine-specific DNA-methyltransferase
VRRVQVRGQSSLLPASNGNGHRPRFLFDETKLRGGYYTPTPIAQFLADWAVRSPDLAVLEPSCGDGEIIAAIAERLGKGGSATGVELFASEAEKASQRGKGKAAIVTGDVFKWYSGNGSSPQYDAVLGNPPFIRYQSFPEEHRAVAFDLMADEGLRPTRLTNAWVPFVALGTRALRPGGRLALVLPAELLQVTYAAELREYLTKKYSRLTVVTFRRLLFEGIQQETVLLLGERGDSKAAEFSFVELESVEGLRFDRVDAAESVPVNLDHAREKWIQYYLSPKEIALVRSIEKMDAFANLGDLADVDVGIVTGRNEFFVLTEGEAKALGVRRWCLPLVGRSAQVPGLNLAEEEWRQLVTAGGKCLLLQLGDRERASLPTKALSYVEWGESSGMHEGFKCRIRLPSWWNVPSVWIPDAFMLRQIHDGPRIIHNDSGATCTDTIHRVRVKNGTDPRWLAAASLNSMTFAFSEIRGRSYGGGVLELEPTEAEGLPFPKPTSELPLDDLDLMLRRKGAEEVLDEVDRLTLRTAGLSSKEIEMLRGVWRKLMQRRLDRKRRGRTK